MKGGLPDCARSFAGPADLRGMSRTRLSHAGRFLEPAPRDYDCHGDSAAFQEATGYQSGVTLPCPDCGSGAQLRVLHPLPAALIRHTDLRRLGIVEPLLAFEEASRSDGSSRKNTHRRRHPLC